jgi:phosphohistidine phosphatase SixA
MLNIQSHSKFSPQWAATRQDKLHLFRPRPILMSPYRRCIATATIRAHIIPMLQVALNIHAVTSPKTDTISSSTAELLP